MTSEYENPASGQKVGLIVGGSFLSGLAAFIGASCCGLPLLLNNLGVSAVLVGKLAFFARAEPYFLGAAIVFLVGATAISFWKGRRPSKFVGITLFLSAIFILAAYMMPHYEPQLLHWVTK